MTDHEFGSPVTVLTSLVFTSDITMDKHGHKWNRKRNNEINVVMPILKSLVKTRLKISQVMDVDVVISSNSFSNISACSSLYTVNEKV